MSVSLVVPVQSLYPAVMPPVPPPPPASVKVVEAAAPPPFACAARRPCDVSTIRRDRSIEERAISEVERLRSELGASDMALEATRSALHRERIEGALDHRATVATAEAAAARHAAAGESFSQPVPGTIAPLSACSEGAAASHASGSSGASALGDGIAPRVGAAETIVVRSRSLIDLFA